MSEHMSNVSRPLATMLDGLFDYAGLFPPAGLDMDAAVASYARGLDTDDGWMIGRFVVPVARLAEFEAAAFKFLPRGEDDEPWALTALTAPAGADAFEQDIEHIAAFNAAHADPGTGLACIDLVELKATDTDGLEQALDGITDDLFPFFELAVDHDPRGLIAALAGSQAGAKVRTGGVKPELYPAPEGVAAFITACAASRVPFKATAGLHHPFRHRNETVGADEFGFMNVLVASAVALHHEAAPDTVTAALVERDHANFVVDDRGLTWRDTHIDVAALEETRLSFFVSLGSCSYDEPRDDLRDLGWLP